jgi:hypothetical protein
MPSTEREGVLVLGMHRSGSSAATRVVNLLGPAVCADHDLIGAYPTNPKGHWESWSLVAFDDRLLGEMGRAWWCPPPSGAGYAAAVARIRADEAEARATLAAAHPSTPWVWKDPRTALVLPFWRRVLGDRIAAVVVVRSPWEVAWSVHRRDRLSPAFGMALWERTYRLVLEHARGLPVAVTFYEDLVARPVEWAESVRAFLERAGVDVAPAVDAAATVEFVESGLRGLPGRGPGQEFPSVAAVERILENCRGPHDVFEPPALPPEPGWVEAELAALGAHQSEPLPRPPVDATQVVAGPVPPGTTPGEYWNAAVAGARAPVLEFRDPGAEVPPAWPADARAGLAAGYAAVGAGQGLAWADGLQSLRPLSRPAARFAGAPVLAPGAVAVDRAAFEACGGFDPGFTGPGHALADLCLRLARFGSGCGVARDSAARTGEQPEADVHDRLRLATIHLDRRRLARAVDALRESAGFAAAAARVATSDAAARRRRLEAEAPTLRDGQKLVFVGGLHRSGTSLVASLLAAHPRASGLAGTGVPEDEGQHLQDVYPPASTFGGPGRFALAPEAHMTEDDPAATPESARRLFAQWAPGWDLSREVLVEKSPPNLVRTRFLQALFPGARFVMVLRHPAVVAAATEKWTPGLAFEDLLENWCTGWETLERDRAQVERLLVVRYEELAGSLEPLGAFAGLEPLDGTRIDPAELRAGEEAWQARMDENGKAWVASLIERFGERVARLGYDLS